MKIPNLLLLIFEVFFLNLFSEQEIGHRFLKTVTSHDYWKPDFTPVT
ncbi:hypothetical protein SAMN05443549_101639 [Flavobacterium fluvii]|uniref:Uncharacterized protein n=1 Tax=Flavobacterium fluvii TaxID=468056 RepID=A0A1M5F6H6_9FLAO|nr:hypothetical protein SAMN05443549_101639 [Flavobacterium fluvii]